MRKVKFRDDEFKILSHLARFGPGNTMKMIKCPDVEYRVNPKSIKVYLRSEGSLEDRGYVFRTPGKDPRSKGVYHLTAKGLYVLTLHGKIHLDTGDLCSKTLQEISIEVGMGEDTGSLVVRMTIAALLEKNAFSTMPPIMHDEGTVNDKLESGKAESVKAIGYIMPGLHILKNQKNGSLDQSGRESLDQYVEQYTTQILEIFLNWVAIPVFVDRYVGAGQLEYVEGVLRKLGLSNSIRRFWEIIIEENILEEKISALSHLREEIDQLLDVSP